MSLLSEIQSHIHGGNETQAFKRRIIKLDGQISKEQKIIESLFVFSARPCFVARSLIIQPNLGKSSSSDI